MTTMLETLDETAAAYTSKNRAKSAISGECRYLIAGKCCAVGRCLENPVKFQKVRCSVTVLDDKYVSLELILKPEYRGFPLKFWESLQRLHDKGIHWNSEGLSERGKKEVAHIKRRFQL